MSVPDKYCGKRLACHASKEINEPDGKQDLHWQGYARKWEACITPNAKCGQSNGENSFFICRACAVRQGLIW